MKNKTKDFLLCCKTLDFGKVELSKAESSFYQRFSNEIVSLCRSLPKSLQTPAILFLMRYSGLNLGDKLDFFPNYYPPAWSILYWLREHDTFFANRLTKGDVTNAVTAQSMAMFLHCLDDHLIDNQVPISGLALLLRSEAWTTMNRACSNLAQGLPLGERTVQRFVDEYYSSIQDANGLRSLDSYCGRFRSQMATWMVAPILLSMKMTGTSRFTRDIEVVYGSFGIAWRLLDDIRDIGDDMKKGARSAIYLCLPKELRTDWNNNSSSRTAAKGPTNAILNHIMEHRVIEKIHAKICAELEAAASLVEAHGMTGLAREFRCLAHPLTAMSVEKSKIGGTFFVNKVPPRPLQETLTAARILNSSEGKIKDSRRR
jgi:hypothetical protein